MVGNQTRQGEKMQEFINFSVAVTTLVLTAIVGGAIAYCGDVLTGVGYLVLGCLTSLPVAIFAGGKKPPEQISGKVWE
jgi:hypothetical protein